MIKAIVGTVVHVATGGAWGALKWLARRFKGNGDRQTFLGRVATFVVGNIALSCLLGRISPWELLKVFGRSILYLCLAVLHLAGGEGKLPDEEDAKAKGFIAKAKDAVDDRMERMKEKLEHEAEEQRKKFDAELTELKRAKDAKELSDGIAKLRKQAEDDASTRKQEVEGARRQLSAKAKAEKLVMVRAASKAKATFKAPGLWGGIPAQTAYDIDREKGRSRAEWIEQQQGYMLDLAKVGIVTPWGWPNSEMRALYEQYKDNRYDAARMYDDCVGPVEDWNAFQRTNDIEERIFFNVHGVPLKHDPGPIEPFSWEHP